MGKFNNDRRGGNFGRDRGSSNQMHHAVCDDCGRDCQVPFKPTSGKPIFCSRCFENHNQSDNSRSNNRDRGMSRGRDNDRNSRDDRLRGLYKAVCDECGENCMVPFRPTNGKPVYCDNCFSDRGDDFDFDSPSNKVKQDNGYKEVIEQLEQLNAKIDRLVTALEPERKVIKQEKKSKVKEAKVEVKKEKKETKPKAKSKAKAKSSTKKKPAKKKA